MRMHDLKAAFVIRRPALQLDPNAAVVLLAALLGLIVTLAVARAGWNVVAPEADPNTAVAAQSLADKVLAPSPFETIANASDLPATPFVAP